MTQSDIKKIVENLIQTFLDAGKISIDLRKKGLTKEIKSDNTPVSNGDLEVNKILSKKILSLTPNIPIVSEETSENKSKNNLENFWLIDPIDGTYDYINDLDEFTINLTNANIEALGAAVDNLVSGLEMGINSETKETMLKFRNSVEYLSEWQKKYMDEIKSVTEAMDQNAVVTQVTTDQLNRTNEVLAELAPVTEKIAASIGWVQKALPTTRKRGIDLDEK